MNSFRVFDRQARRVAAAVALLTATVAPALVPALVAAETVTERSVQLSSSTKGTSGVEYTVSFKPVASSTGAFVIDFCTDAAIDTACTAPGGLDVTTPTTPGSDTVSKVDSNTVKVVLNTAVTPSDTATVVLRGLTNPTNAGSIYARVVTYQDGTTNYHYTAADDLGSYQDSGSVALQITDGFSVSGIVAETLTFCAARNDDTIGTGCTGTLHAPDVTLGTGGILAAALSEGVVKTQISTNAVSGAAVWLKNSAAGGGLKRAEASTSDITPMASAGAINSGDGKFGLKLANLGATTGQVDPQGAYNTSNYYMEYQGDNSAGVTSTYGSKVYDTHGAPISNGTADLTFGANISNVTPAGSYSASLNLIATGKF